jgi:hypothetical protein
MEQEEPKGKVFPVHPPSIHPSWCTGHFFGFTVAMKTQRKQTLLASLLYGATSSAVMTKYQQKRLIFIA